MKPKRNQKADTNISDERDRCETPAYALDPLLPFLPASWRIWEPACGSGRIVRALQTRGYAVWGTDLLEGKNFFQHELRTIAWEAIVTNPPYSIKVDWIRRCYELGNPFALLVPVETISLPDVQTLMEQHGADLLLLNKRVNFYMPSGKDGSAQFPVLWFCWRLLPAPIVYGRITRRKDEQLTMEFA